MRSKTVIILYYPYKNYLRYPVVSTHLPSFACEIFLRYRVEGRLMTLEKSCCAFPGSILKNVFLSYHCHSFLTLQQPKVFKKINSQHQLSMNSHRQFLLKEKSVVLFQLRKEFMGGLGVCGGVIEKS